MVHKTGEFLGNRIPGAVTNSYDNKVLQLKSVEQKLFRQKNKKTKLNKLRQVL